MKQPTLARSLSEEDSSDRWLRYSSSSGEEQTLGTRVKSLYNKEISQTADWDTYPDTVQRAHRVGQTIFGEIKVTYLKKLIIAKIIQPR